MKKIPNRFNTQDMVWIRFHVRGVSAIRKHNYKTCSVYFMYIQSLQTSLVLVYFELDSWYEIFVLIYFVVAKCATVHFVQTYPLWSSLSKRHFSRGFVVC